jgi:uncharacterized short protein YbdD (DUF466 family)
MFVMQYGHVFNQLKGNEPDGTPDNYDEFWRYGWYCYH